MTEPTPEKPARPYVIGMNALQDAATARGNYLVRVPNDKTREDVLRPSAWANMVPLLSRLPHARIEVVREDGTLDMDLRVLECSPGMVRMLVLREYVNNSNLEAAKAEANKPAEAPTVDLVAPDGYKIVHLPAAVERGWAIQLVSTGEWLEKKIPDKGLAVAKAKAHKLKAEAIPA